MNDMIVKSVDLMGDTIMAAQDSEGSIWAGIRWFCQGLGFSKGQIDRQIKNIQKDSALKKGASNLTLPTNGGKQEVFCIKLDFVPLWLAKISISEKTKQDHPELADKLLEYQLKAKDILAAAFLPQQSGESGELRKQIRAIAQGTDELYSRMDELEGRFTKFEDELPVTGKDMDDIQSAVRKKGAEVLGGKESNAYHDNSTRAYVYADIQCELRRQFGVKKYKEIKHKDAPDAIRIIVNYELPIELKNRVDMVNAQESLDLEGGVR